QNRLSAAQRKGSDPVQVLSATRDMVLRAQSDDSLALIGRGSNTASGPDFTIATGTLFNRGGLLATAEPIERRSESAEQIRSVRRELAAVNAAHRRVDASEKRGNYNRAVAIYIHDEAPRADTLNRTLSAQTAEAQSRFVTDADSAASATDGMKIGVPLLALA